MRMVDRIEQRLRGALAPMSLNVIDESRLHAGHAGAPGGGESHFRIEIVSAAFRDKGRIERQRMIYDLLQEEMRGGIHALSISAKDDPQASLA